MARDILGELGIAPPVNQTVPTQGEPKDIGAQLGFQPGPGTKPVQPPRDMIAELGLDQPKVEKAPDFSTFEKIRNTVFAPSDMLANVAMDMGKLPVAGLTGIGSLLAGEGLDKSTERINDVMGFARRQNPMADKLAEYTLQPLQEHVVEPIAKKFGESAMSFHEMTGSSPEDAAAFGAVGHAFGELGTWAAGAKLLHSIFAKAPVKDLVVKGPGTDGKLYSSRFEYLKAQHPEMSLGEFLRKYPEFKEQEFAKRAQSEQAKPAEPTAKPAAPGEKPAAPKDAATAEFFKVADEFGGYENIPENHPVWSTKSPSEQLKMINAYEKKGKPVKEKAETAPKPGKKLTFKEKLEEEVKGYKSLTEVEKAFAKRTRHLKAAKTIWKRQNTQPVEEVVDEEPVAPPVDEFNGDMLPDDVQTPTPVQETPVEETPRTKAPVSDQNIAVEVIEPNENTLRAEEAAAYEKEMFQQELAQQGQTDPLRSKIEHSEPPTPVAPQEVKEPIETQSEEIIATPTIESPIAAPTAPVKLYRGTTSGGLTGRDSYAMFASTSPHVAASYGDAIPFDLKAGSEIIEFPVKKSTRSKGNEFDKFAFDDAAKKLKPGQVLVARNVYDPGPLADNTKDPEMLYSYASDIYAFPSKEYTTIPKTIEAKQNLSTMSPGDTISFSDKVAQLKPGVDYQVVDTKGRYVTVRTTAGTEVKVGKSVLADGVKKGLTWSGPAPVETPVQETVKELEAEAVESETLDRLDKINFDRLETAVEELDAPLENEIAPTPKKEVIKVSEFTKIGDNWIGNVDAERAVAIIKDGKAYDAYLGTPAEIQAGTAQLVESFKSLQSARKAFGAEGKKVTTKKQLDPAKVIEAIRAIRDEALAKKEALRQAELDQLMLDQEADMLGEEPIDSWEEMAEKEAMSDYDEDGWFDERDLSDTMDDLTKIMRDDRGQLFPKSNSEISKAKRRIAKDVKKLGRILTSAKAKYPGGDPLVSATISQADKTQARVDSAYERVKKFMADEEGAVNFTVLSNAIHEVAIALRNAWRSVKRAAKTVKDWLFQEQEKNPYRNYNDKERRYMLGNMKDTMTKMVDAFKTNSSAANKAFYDSLVASRRIVPRHDGKSTEIPVSQVATIEVSRKPQMKPGVEKMPTVMFGKQASPSNIFREIFMPWSNPSIDYMEAVMESATNTSNEESWARALLKPFKDEHVAIKAHMDKLYEPLKPLISAKIRGERKLNALKQHLGTLTDPAARSNAKKRLVIESKKQNNRSKKIMEQMTEIYDNNIHDVIRKFPSIKVSLQAARELPAGVTLTPKEIQAAEKMREYLDMKAVQMKRRGIPIKSDGAYMTRLLPEIFSDTTVNQFVDDKGIPALLKFRHQDEKGRLWYPSPHAIMGFYIPVVNRKLSMQQFLNRWHEPMSDLPTDINDYMTNWLAKNLFAQPRSTWAKIVDNVIAFEYLRTVGFALSPGFKHSVKLLDTLAMFDAVTNFKATTSVMKASVQYTKGKLGAKGESVEQALMRAFISQKAIVRLMDDAPGTKSLMYDMKMVSGTPTRLVETIENGVTIFANVLSNASQKKFTPEQATQIIWETIMAANFRGGSDQPLFYKNAGGRLIGMLQSTRFKLFEFRVGTLKRAYRGELDHWGTNGSTILVRYLFYAGMAEEIARFFGNTLMELWVHPPFVGHIATGTKDFPFVALHEPKVDMSPPLQLVADLHQYGVGKGALRHFTQWNMPSRLYNLSEGKRPKGLYKDPVSYLLGIQKLDATPDRPKGKK